ncbi:MAG: N-6 DNA methylase [Nitrosopumilus sp.]|nr:N-6 DNA methylase [Nitrosopumilus sp.]
MTIIEQLDTIRIEASKNLDQAKRSELGQFMTPTIVANFMASLFLNTKSAVRILDPGAGIGSLAIALLDRIKTKNSTTDISLTAYEIDQNLIVYLKQNLKTIRRSFEAENINLNANIADKDFILEGNIINNEKYTHAILNPPYKKINSNSDHRLALRKIGQEHVNLYSAFVAKSLELLEKKGQLVAIIPRSFCNGLYYKPFRRYILENAAIKHIHLFESRTHSFKDDNVLQENVIIHLQKGVNQKDVTISYSADRNLKVIIKKTISFESVIKNNDSELFIHIPNITQTNLNTEDRICYTLEDIGLQVSTGPVVDFRVTGYLRMNPTKNSMPLIYATHFSGNGIEWPKVSKKPNALAINNTTLKASLPNGFYTVVKRFSSKEEKQRIVARVVKPQNFNSDVIGLENHLNYFHFMKQGINENLAFGLAAYLNTSYVDQHFRAFNGHTQVNATDLRQLKYPSRETLIEIGKWAKYINIFTPENLDQRIMASL